jgi:dihydroneopterin aldolase|tara:strand:- start:5428 stop:5790 length:363 start_codon:yes stop_codon:yes gene_type:complete
MDKIGLTGMTFYGKHGTTREEKASPQEFIVDIEILKDLQKSGNTDSLDDTIDYSKVYMIVKSIIEETSFNLIEGISDAIATKIMDTFDVNKIIIKVTKSNAPMGDNHQNAWVQISREKGS